jgi:hypothetical protein
MDSADASHALVEGGEAAIRTAVLVIGAPWIVLGIGVRADPSDADENRGHEEESFHGASTPFELLRMEPLDPLEVASSTTDPNGDVGHKSTIHYINMGPVSAGSIDGPDFLAEVRKISRQNERRYDDRPRCSALVGIIGFTHRRRCLLCFDQV